MGVSRFGEIKLMTKMKRSQGCDITLTGDRLMIKYVLVVALMILGSSTYAGECANGHCTLRSRVVNVTQEIVAVPVAVTRRTVEATRNVGRRTVARVRSVVR
jgi:hypothetical protein